MSMSTSLKSEATVLLWGQSWWTAGKSEPVPFASLAEAVTRLLSARSDLPKHIRLIYEPTGFSTIPTDCPQADRTTLALSLAAIHPELAVPDIAWSHEPILRRGDTFHTLLHLETVPALHQLVRSFAEAGYQVRQAWPLPTWLNALPSDLTETGAVLMAAMRREAVCLYRFAADGARTIERWHGDKALADLATYLRAVFTRNPSESVWLVPAEPTLVGTLNELLPLADKPAVEVLELAATLDTPAIFGPRHPAQLLQPGPIITLGGIASVASVACLLGAVSLLGSYAWHYASAQRATALRERQKVVLRAEIEPLRANAEEITRCQTQIAGRSSSPPVAAILTALGTDLPAEIALNHFVATSDGFTVAGGVAPGSTRFGPWLEALRQAHPKLALGGGLPDANGLFTLEGKGVP